MLYCEVIPIPIMEMNYFIIIIISSSMVVVSVHKVKVIILNSAGLGMLRRPISHPNITNTLSHLI